MPWIPNREHRNSKLRRFVLRSALNSRKQKQFSREYTRINTNQNRDFVSDLSCEQSGELIWTFTLRTRELALRNRLLWIVCWACPIQDGKVARGESELMAALRLAVNSPALNATCCCLCSTRSRRALAGSAPAPSITRLCAWI